jgi:hypothetical protein
MTARSSVRIVAIAAALALALTASASAQPSFTATIGRWFESTTSTASDPGDARTTAAHLAAEYQTASERVRLYYDLDAGDFSAAGSWGYVLQTAGVSSRVDVRQGKHQVFFGGQAAWRTNGASWSNADFAALEGVLNAQLKLQPSTTLRMGYRLDVRRFPELQPLNHIEQLGFASLLVNLPSRTTLIGEVQFGRKNYERETATTLTPSASFDVGSRWRGHGLRVSASAAAPDATATGQDADRAGQITWLGRLARSLSDRTGASVQYARRRTFGTVPPAIVETPPLFFEDGVYDDPYASDLDTLSATLKHVRPRGDVLEGWAAWIHKPYVATVALDTGGQPRSGDPRREDRVVRAGLSWTIPVRPGRTGSVDLDLIPGYLYTHSRSNDAFFTYTSHQVGVSVAVGF